MQSSSVINLWDMLKISDRYLGRLDMPNFRNNGFMGTTLSCLCSSMAIELRPGKEASKVINRKEEKEEKEV